MCKARRDIPQEILTQIAFLQFVLLHSCAIYIPLHNYFMLRFMAVMYQIVKMIKEYEYFSQGTRFSFVLMCCCF